MCGYDHEWDLFRKDHRLYMVATIGLTILMIVNNKNSFSLRLDPNDGSLVTGISDPEKSIPNMMILIVNHYHNTTQ